MSEPDECKAYGEELGMEGNTTEYAIARHIPASKKAVTAILNAPVGADGRSVWQWFRLANGDLILGAFPTGDMYCEWEHEHAF